MSATESVADLGELLVSDPIRNANKAVTLLANINQAAHEVSIVFRLSLASSRCIQLSLAKFTVLWQGCTEIALKILF